MAVDPSAPRTRRALLGAALGATAATVASTIARPVTALAADGDAMVVGGEYTATSVTKITQSGAGLDAIFGMSGTGTGIVGGATGAGTGVWGNAAAATSLLGTGVLGTGAGWGVWGESTSTTKPATTGWSTGNNVGVLGWSGNQEELTTFPETSLVSDIGVYGRCDTNEGSVGVFAKSQLGTGIRASGGAAGIEADGLLIGISVDSGQGPAIMATSSAIDRPSVMSVAFNDRTGVYGHSGSGDTAILAGKTKTGVLGTASQDTASIGVEGISPAGAGVRGSSSTGTGGSFTSTSGYAIKSSGRVSLAKASGYTTIAAGSKSKTVTPGTDLGTSSIAIATLQGSAGGTISVHRVAVNATTNKVTIYLTGTATRSVRVGWIVLN